MTVRFAIGYGWLIATAYFALGVWAALTSAWHSGALLWPDSDAQAPSTLPQTLTLTLVIAWLVYGLAWPVGTARAWLWMALGVIQTLALMIAGWWGFAMAAVVLHTLAFDPRWLPGAKPARPETIFYDGGCGLCHRGVKRILRADPQGGLFNFAPLQGSAIKKRLTDEQREALADSVVVRTRDGRVLQKSTATVHILDALGGWYRLGAVILRVMPQSFRDLGYDGVARIRHRLFAKPAGVCPVLPEELRERFLL